MSCLFIWAGKTNLFVNTGTTPVDDTLMYATDSPFNYEPLAQYSVESLAFD